MVKILLKEKADINATDKKGLTALHKAVKSGCLKMVKLLVEDGKADVNIESSKEFDSCCVLQDAAFNGQQEIVQYLLEQCAEVDKRNMQGKTPLHRAVYKNHSAIVQLLLDCAADIDAQDDSGRTALHWSAVFGHLDCFKILLENGADFEVKDKTDLTCCDIARKRNQQKILLYLQQQQSKL